MQLYIIGECRDKMSEKKTIFLTIEVFQREFKPVLTLASVLIESGYRVYIGHIGECLYLANNLSKKAIFKHNSGFSNILRNRYENKFEHIIAIEDLESSISLPDEKKEEIICLRMRPQVESYDYNIFLCPTCTHTGVLNRLIKEYDRSGKAYTVGRIGFGNIVKRKLHKKTPVEKKMIKYKYKIIIFSSFGAVNDDDWMREFSNPEVSELEIELMKERYLALSLVVKFVKELSRLIEVDTCIIFRPHNAERIQDWENIFRGLSNINIRKNDDLDLLIDMGDILAHTSSNIAIQAATRGKKTFNICPVGNMRTSIGAKLSTEVYDPNLLISALKSNDCNGKEIIDESIAKLEESGVCMNSDEEVANSIVKIFDEQEIYGQGAVIVPIEYKTMLIFKKLVWDLFFTIITSLNMTKYMGKYVYGKIDRYNKKGLNHLCCKTIRNQLHIECLDKRNNDMIIVKKVLPFSYLLEKK